MSNADGAAKPTIERTVKVAEGAGVCFGVKRALRLAEEALVAGTTVYGLGPLIHNPQEVGRLTEKGFQVIETLDEADEGATLLIRSHGVSPDVVAEAKRRGHRIIDATCPLVRRVQTLATGLEQEGYQVIVAGDAAHPEVRAIQGHAPRAVVVSAPEAVAGLQPADRVALVAQTTFSPEVFRQMAAALVQRPFGEVRPNWPTALTSWSSSAAVTAPTPTAWRNTAPGTACRPITSRWRRRCGRSGSRAGRGSA